MRVIEAMKLFWLLNCSVYTTQTSSMVGNRKLESIDLMNRLHITECSFAITPTGEPHQPRLIIYMYTTSRLQTINSNRSRTNTATVTTRSTQQKVNNSFCYIASLEVYRGREKAIEINHTGFVLDNSGTIEVIDTH